MKVGTGKRKEGGWGGGITFVLDVVCSYLEILKIRIIGHYFDVVPSVHLI